MCRSMLLLLLLQAGHSVVLCREETSPEDVGGMHAAEVYILLYQCNRQCSVSCFCARQDMKMLTFI